MHRLTQDIRYALRSIRRNPAFTTVAVVTLALGIGISTAVFTAVNGVLLQPLRFPQPERIVSLNTQSPGQPASFSRVTGGDFVNVRQSNKVFDAISVYFGGEVGVQLRGRAEFTGIQWVNPEFFKIFGQNVPAPSAAGAIVGEAFAARHFGDAAHAVGKTLQVENRAYEIAAVLPGPRFPADTEIWLPAPFTPENSNHSSFNYHAVARLRPGISLAQAEGDLDTIAAALGVSYPNTNHGRKLIAVPLREQLTGPVQSTLYLLLGAVLLVLLIACANVSNLLLARATVRAREIALRSALGASRAGIIAMLVVESLMLSVFGGLLGIALASWGARALAHFAPPTLPRAGDIRIDTAVLAFAIGLSVLSAVAFGILPALQASRAEFSSRGVLPGGSHTLRNSLVVVEIALSFVLATGAGLFFRGFLALNASEMGFRPNHTLVMSAHAPAKDLNQYVDVGRAFVDQLLPAISRLPGVQSAAAVMGLPAGDYGSNGSYAVLGKQVYGEGQKMPESNWALSSPNYFAAMGIPLLRGRDFTPLDRYQAPSVIVVSESIVKQIFPGEDPLGRQIVCGLDLVSLKPMTIVGVVGDVRQNSPASAPEPTLYMPLEQHPYYGNELQIVVRTAGVPAAMTAAVRKTAYDLNPDMAVKFTTLDQMIADSVAAPRFRTFLAGAFAALALLLAMAGIYGVMNYIVTQRTAEMGLRLALGASGRDVIALVLKRAAILAAAGLAIGAGLSLALSRLVASMLFEVKPADPATYALVLLSVATVAILAAAGPAVRASRIDPIAALRED